jgi:hypothetical protein
VRPVLFSALRAAERWRGLIVVGVVFVGFESARRIFLNSSGLVFGCGGRGSTVRGPDSYMEVSGMEEDVDWFCIFDGCFDGLETGSCMVEIIFIQFCFWSEWF